MSTGKTEGLTTMTTNLDWERLRIHTENNIRIFAQEQMQFFRYMTGCAVQVSVRLIATDPIPEDMEIPEYKQLLLPLEEE